MATRYLMNANFVNDDKSFNIKIDEQYLRDEGFAELLDELTFQEVLNQIALYHPMVFDKLNDTMRDMMQHLVSLKRKGTR